MKKSWVRKLFSGTQKKMKIWEEIVDKVCNPSPCFLHIIVNKQEKLNKYQCQSLAFGWFEIAFSTSYLEMSKEYFGSKQPILALTSNACTFYVDEVFWWWFSYLYPRMMTRKIARNKGTLNKTFLLSSNFFRLGAFFNPLSAISNLFVNPFIRRIILGFMPYKKAFCWKICQVPAWWVSKQKMSIFLFLQILYSERERRQFCLAFFVDSKNWKSRSIVLMLYILKPAVWKKRKDDSLLLLNFQMQSTPNLAFLQIMIDIYERERWQKYLWKRNRNDFSWGFLFNLFSGFSWMEKENKETIA